MEPEENLRDGAALTKLDLNNQIVRMRHNVNRAKVQTLNKLTHRIKILRNKKEPGSAKGKNVAKAERLLQEFLIMKKIPPDEVAAFSLSNTKSVDDILKDVSSSWRLKALARLSTHKSLVPVVEMFRSNYPSWEKDLSKVLIALKKRKKLKTDDNQPTKNKKNKSQSDTGSSVKGGWKSSSFNSDNVKINVDVPNSGSERSDSDAEIFNSDDEMYSGNERSQSDDQLSDSCVQKTEKEESFVSTRGNRFSISSDDFNLTNFNQEKPLKDPHQHSQSQSLSETLMKCEDSPIVTSAQKNVDPFFIGSNNEEYKTVNPVVEMTYKDEEILHRKLHLEDENLDYKWRSDKCNNRDKLQRYNDNFGRSMKSIAYSKNRDNFRRGSFNNDKRFNDKVAEDRQYDDKIVKSLGKSRKAFEVEPKIKLHPSWEAKKKQNSTVQFSGKKIVFD